MNNRQLKTSVIVMKYIFIIIFGYLITTNIYAQTNINLSNLSFTDGEPYIAINPANENNIIAGWMRLRLDGKIWIATKASFDKGNTWSAINFMPHDSSINNSADVIIAFHKSGIAYLAYVDYRTSPDSAGGIYILKSIDGGLSWNDPVKIFDKNDSQDIPIDRPWIAVDNSGGVNDGTIYITSMSAYFYEGQHHVYMRTSSNEGASWSDIKQIDDSLNSVGLFKVSYATVSVGGDGLTYIAYMSYVNLFVKKFIIATTSDKGNTFQRYPQADVYPAFLKLPAYSISADPINNSYAYLTWCDTRHGDLDVLFSKTTNSGQNWSNPIRINDDSINNGIIQDQVWSSISTTGKIAIAWRDRRLSDIGTNVPFDIFYSVSTDNGDTFSSNYRASSVSSPYFSVSCCNSFIGVAITDSFIVSNWGDYRDSNWEVYFNRTDIATITSLNNSKKSIQFNIDVFPNPAYNDINITFLTNYDISKYEIIIYNTFGEIKQIIPVSNAKSNVDKMQIDISKLNDGVYFLYLKENNTYFANKKFVKLSPK